MDAPPPPPPPPAWSAPAWPVVAPPKAPGATLAMVLGIVSVGGFFVLVLPVFAAPVAWHLGVRARREIERDPTLWSGAVEARAGTVLGMIGTAIMALALVVLLAVCGLLVLASRYDGGYGT
jgi:hypothetical protein